MPIALSLSLALSVPAQPAPQADSVTAGQIRSAYEALIRIEPLARPGATDTMMVLDVAAPPAGHLLASFFQDHEFWLSYLILNGRGFQLPGLHEPAPGVPAATPHRQSPSALKAEFVRRLAADSQFNALAVPAIAEHLHRTGTPVAAGLVTRARGTIPLDSAMRVVVRFFYPDFFIQDQIGTHVCTVFNAIRELPSRNLALEALAFSAIYRDIRRRDSSLIEQDFGPARRLMNALDAPGPKELRLHRAQGVMWGLMAASPRLREVLLAEAKRQSDVLPFEFRAP